jgi:hypothetical protein
MRKALLIVIALAGLSACDQAKQGFDEGFNKSFDEKFSASCVTSATKSGAPAAIASQVCDCTLKKINERFSATEKMTAGNDKLMPLMEECVKSVVPTNG